jgi:preprotein translocase subunit SecA
MRELFRLLFSYSRSSEDKIRRIIQRRNELANVSDETLREAGRRSRDLVETIAITAIIAARVLGLVMFDVQIQGAVALAEGKIAEMQTGEGKTLAAVPAVVWYAKEGQGVHVMTSNDYLARRARRHNDFNEHGRPGNRYQTRRWCGRSRGAIRHRNQSAREPAHR